MNDQPKLNESNDELAKRHGEAAVELMRGVRVLARNTPRSSSALAHLAAKTLSHVLQAHLLDSGVPQNRLTRRERSSDLDTLWREASAGGSRVDGVPPQWVMKLSRLLRVSNSTGAPRRLSFRALPRAQPMSSDLRDLVVAVADDVGVPHRLN